MATVRRSQSVTSFGVPRESLFVPKEAIGSVRQGDAVREIPEELEVEDGLYYFPPEWEEALEKVEAEIEKAEKDAQAETARQLLTGNVTVESILKKIAEW